MDDKSFEKAMKKIKNTLTPEYIEKVKQDCYKEDREYPENFSNWYKHIVDFGKFKHAEIISTQIFSYEETKIMSETDIFEKVDFNKINNILLPTLNSMEDGKLYSIKNGCFSNKFDFQTCAATKKDLAEKLWLINYQSSMFGAGGYTELVVREFISYTDNKTPTIYNGMPLREEVRAFYNLDTKKIEYIVDYWDYDYCNEHLNLTDKIVFDWFHNKTPGRNESHNLILENMKTIICERINTLKFDDELKGIWSIDFLLEDNQIYLIDMARGFRSAYWNPENISKKQ